MKRSATVIAASALIGTPTFAADMAVKAPPPAPAPVYSWTGWYVGGNVGYSWGDAQTDIAGSGTSVSLPGFLVGFHNPSAFAGSNTARLNGVIGGGQVGYNYQTSAKWVLGGEADIQGSGERGSSSFPATFSTPFCAVGSGNPFIGETFCLLSAQANGVVATSYEAKIDWFGTVRGRLGYLVTDELLLYATGGLAYGRVGVSGNSNVSGSTFANFANGTFPFSDIGPGTTAFSASRTNVGFTVGGGMEGRFSYWLPANWTWKLEYLYMDLGSLDTANPFPPARFSGSTPITGTLTTHTHFTDNIVRVGLNYRFH